MGLHSFNCKVTAVNDIQYIKNILQPELGYARRKRERRCATMLHFVHSGTQQYNLQFLGSLP